MSHRYETGHVLTTDAAYHETPPAEHAAPPGQPRRKNEFVRISLRSLLSIGAILFAILSAWFDVKSDGRSMRTLLDEHTAALAKREATDAETMRMLISLNAKVEVLLARDPGRGSP